MSIPREKIDQILLTLRRLYITAFFLGWIPRTIPGVSKH
jgi:hypothetical protein